MPADLKLRCFLAISAECPPTLARVLRELGQMGSAVKASSPRGLHCTLKFLGPTSPEAAVALGVRLPGAIADIAKFVVELRGIGAFPHADRPSVIWAGLSAPELSELQARVETLASEFGYAPESRPFHPHVTLARVKHRPPPALQQILREHAAAEWGHFEVAAVELFKSTLTPGGSHYEMLARARLGG